MFQISQYDLLLCDNSLPSESSCLCRCTPGKFRVVNLDGL